MSPPPVRPRTVLVPATRVTRWCANFADRHGETTYAVRDGALCLGAEDGSTAVARLPFDGVYDGSASPQDFADTVLTPARWGVLLVRKGGFAVARLAAERVVESKVGRRHVQGRTKAGGQSQQRFARRRGHQAREAYTAAADHAARVLGTGLDALVTGGDHAGVEAVLDDPRVAPLRPVVVGPWLPVPDPRRSELESAVAQACSVTMSVTNA